MTAVYKMRFGLKFLLITAFVSIASAQLPTYHLGKSPSNDEIQAWDIAIGPDGKELPSGQGTAREGAKVFAQWCASCHGPTGTEAKFHWGVLVGGQGTLTTARPVETVGSYWPYATTVWDFINRAMPHGKEGVLTPDQVYAVTAWILWRNGIVKEDEVMNAKTLANVKMPNRNGFIPPIKDLHRWHCPRGVCP